MSTLIEKIDKGLEQYYKSQKRNDYKDDGVGKFAFFVEESGFDDDGIDDELKQAPDESTILEFDDDFPFAQKIEDEDARNAEIHRILNDIAKYGAPRDALETMELRVDICYNVNPNALEECTKKYTSQMESLRTLQGGDGDLQWFLAVGNQQNYPFLAYMVDSYTKENAEHHFKSAAKKKSQGDLAITSPFTVTSWLEKQSFFRALHRKYPTKADQLKSAMRNYTNRIMGRLKLTPTFKIDDNLSDIVQYLVSVPQFINNLLSSPSTAIPPFQVDLVIAVYGVIAQVNNDDADQPDDDDDYDDEEDDNEVLDPKLDHVGNVQKEFKAMKPPIYYAPPNGPFALISAEEKEQPNRIKGIGRVLDTRFKEFRTVLSGNPPDNANKKHYIQKKSKHYNPKTYPSRRRFCVFVDRRKEKPTKGEEDEMTIFEPPNDCNMMSDNHVPEIGFAFLTKCILPKTNKHITAKDPLCGQLLTFMFNVEANDEIKCYIVWCGQTMRFHGDHISKILPFIFADSKDNKRFCQSKETQLLQDMFDKHNDRKFAKFYLALKNFGK